MAYLDQFLSVIVKHGGSDLHFAEGQPPKMRVHGDIMPIRAEPISREEAVQMMSEICGVRNWETFEQSGDLDFAYEMDEASRFRSNYFKQSNGYGATFRLIPTKIATLEQLGIPLGCKRLCEFTRRACPGDWSYWLRQNYHASCADRLHQSKLCETRRNDRGTDRIRA